MQATMDIAEHLHYQPRMRRGILAMMTPAPSRADDSVEAALQNGAVVFAEATDQHRGRRYAPAKIPQRIIPVGGTGNLLGAIYGRAATRLACGEIRDVPDMLRQPCTTAAC